MTAIIAITRNGARTGLKLKENLPQAELYVLRKYHGAAGKAAHPFDDLKELLGNLWQCADAFICIMATGIVVRMIAPHLQRKDVDPAVVVMDDAARFSISLLSGHLGGANELAERVAFITGARAVVTTATDANELPSFDMIAQEEGWEIEDLTKVKTLNALLLDGGKIAVVDHTGRIRSRFHGHGNLAFHDDFLRAVRSMPEGLLFVTNSIIPPQVMRDELLVLRPKNLVLGIGCNSGTAADEIAEVVTAHLKRLFLSPRSVARIATATAKKEEPGLLEYAEREKLPVTFYESDELNAVAVPSPPSPHALQAIGATGVAEPAALLASGGGTLLLQKVKSGNVTLAIAEKKP